LNTVAHLEYLRDYGLPFTLKLLDRNLQALKTYGAQGEEQARRAQEDVFEIENSIKALKGQYEGLKGESLLAKKRVAESELRRAIAADPKKQAEYGDAWDIIARGRKELPSYYREYSLFENRSAFNST